MPTLSTNIATTAVPLGYIQRRVWPNMKASPVHKLKKRKGNQMWPVSLRYLMGLAYHPTEWVPPTAAQSKLMVKAKTALGESSARWTELPEQGFLEGSKFKGDLYHGTNAVLKPGDRLRPDLGGEYGIYLTTRHRYAKNYGPNLYVVWANFKRPLVVENKGEIAPRDLTKEDINRLRKQGYDAIVETSSSIDRAHEIVLFDPEQAFVVERRR